MSLKRVYILGAGSSIGHSKGRFPSIINFFSKAKNLRLDLKKDFKELSEYVEHVMGKLIYDGRTRINIEELFTYIEIEIERKPSWDLLAIRQQLFKLIQDVLIGLQKQTNSHQGEYDDFVTKILKPNDTIITLNWDLLLDNALNREDVLGEYKRNGNIKDTFHGHYLHFIIDLSALGERTWVGNAIKEPYHLWEPKGGYYLKAHGSVDWFYCSNKDCRGSHKVFPLLDQAQQYSCSECHEPLELLIIPPVLNKGYRQYPLIRRIWNLAAQEVRSVNEMIIWGYSLPPTDFYFSWLIRQAREANIQKLIIINPDTIMKYQGRYIVNRGFVKRFYEIFRNIIAEESLVLYESFGDYLSGEDILKKYNLEEPKIAYS